MVLSRPMLSGGDQGKEGHEAQGKSQALGCQNSQVPGSSVWYERQAWQFRPQGKDTAMASGEFLVKD